MASRPEILVFGCREDDLAVLRSVSGPRRLVLRAMETAGAFAEHAVARHPVAAVIGVGPHTLANLDVIPLVRAVRTDLPVIVVAEEDSLDLERSARQRGIFYYIVRPVDRSEVSAVLSDIVRHSRG